ncbi:winged helix domain-containing protein [Vannielia sp. SX4]|uniref:winged helix domain-containing protein n=1 Tax=Vannielia sp. SX4 TaxID=3463852 RepID=UPI0040593E77
MKIEVTLLSEQSRTFHFDGRMGWAMVQLANAGAKGVTPVTNPAPRWSAYVHKLRKAGIPIETEMEEHGGTYSGHHGRYRLACDAQVRILGPEVLT